MAVAFFVVVGAGVLLREKLGLGDERAGTDVGDGGDALHYRGAGALLSEAERRFFVVLEEAVRGSRLRVMCKVRLGDVVQADFKKIHASAGDGKQGKRLIASARNRVERKHCDFVLVDRETFEVWGMVELDDASHRGGGKHGSEIRATQERDKVKDAALASAGVRVFRQRAAGSYEVEGVRGLLRGGVESEVVDSGREH